jgi:hypothetical protein
MKRYATFAIPLALALTLLVSAGCLQVVKLVSLSLGNLSAVNGAASAGRFVDVDAENSTYHDNKSKFKDVSDVAVLGTFTNNTANPVNADVWIVESQTGLPLLANLAAVQGAGGVLMWSMSLGANETKTLSWDNSAALFTSDGKTALESELEGDAKFGLYIFGNTGTYNITVTGASVEVMIGADFSGP